MIAVMAARLAAIAPLTVDTVVMSVRIIPTAMTITYVLTIVVIVGPAIISTTRAPVTMDSTAMGPTPARAVVAAMPAVPAQQVRPVSRQPILVQLVRKTATVMMVMPAPPIPATAAFVNIPTTQSLAMMVSTVTEPIAAWAEAAKYTPATPVWPMKPVTKPPTLAARLMAAAGVLVFPCAMLISAKMTVPVSRVREIVILTFSVPLGWFAGKT
jgi:hypothetical protein